LEKENEESATLRDDRDKLQRQLNTSTTKVKTLSEDLAAKVEALSQLWSMMDTFWSAPGVFKSSNVASTFHSMDSPTPPTNDQAPSSINRRPSFKCDNHTQGAHSSKDATSQSSETCFLFASIFADLAAAAASSSSTTFYITRVTSASVITTTAARTSCTSSPHDSGSTRGW
jgi:hypothetical protein